MPNLRNFLFGFSGPSMMMSRLANLLDRSRLSDIDGLISPTSPLKAPLRIQLSRPHTLADFIDYNLLRDAWEERVTEMKSTATPRRNIAADCDVLARLELVNRGAPDDLRVVHITGDQAVLNAARLYAPTGGESFAQLYLRDPRSFLAEPEVFFGADGDGGQSPTELIEWLDVFLGNFTDGPEQLLANLERLITDPHQPDRALAAQVLENNAQAATEFDQRWRDFCAAIALDLAGATREATTPIDQLLLALDQYGGIKLANDGTFDSLENILLGLKNIVDARVDETWRSCFGAATRVGFTLVRSGSGARRSRYPAPIMFEGFAAAADFFTDMLKDVPSDNHEQVLAAFTDADDYVFYLAFAGLFGAQGKWHTARVLAERALETVESGPRRTPEGIITGREAHYLRAISARLTARNSHDMEDAERSLDAAARALRIDRRDADDHPVTTLRFEAEAIAFRLSRCLLRRFTEESPDWTEPLGDWRSDTHALVARVDREFSDESLRDRVRIALLVNYLMAVMLSDEPKTAASGRKPQDLDILHLLRVTASRIQDAGGGTYLVTSVLLAATAALEPPLDRAIRRRLISAVEHHFSNTEINANRTTVYDRQRFAYLKRLALKHLAAPPRRPGHKA